MVFVSREPTEPESRAREVAKEKAKERSDRNAQLGRYELTPEGFMPQTWVRQVEILRQHFFALIVFCCVPL